jgi:hypothetical protein
MRGFGGNNAGGSSSALSSGGTTTGSSWSWLGAGGMEMPKPATKQAKAILKTMVPRKVVGKRK